MKINGAIILNKERGLSSFQAARKVKNIIGADKAGHTGTLDPMASGVLVVCLGKHTRLVEYLVQDDKEYKVEMLLGLSTDTFDLEGEIISTGNVRDIKNDDILKCLQSFKGQINQKPPIYSAIKVKGKKLYEYARKGIEVEIPNRIVDIRDIANIVIKDSLYKGYAVRSVSFDVVCSKGTYIRSLCNDIGEHLGCYGTMAQLSRTVNGKFSIKDAFTLEEIEHYFEKSGTDEILINPIPYAHLKMIQLNESESERYMSGLKILKIDIECGEYFAVLSNGLVAGIGIIDEKGFLKSRKRLI